MIVISFIRRKTRQNNLTEQNSRAQRVGRGHGGHTGDALMIIHHRLQYNIGFFFFFFVLVVCGVHSLRSRQDRFYRRHTFFTGIFIELQRDRNETRSNVFSSVPADLPHSNPPLDLD